MKQTLYIARKKVKDSHKANLCDYYKSYANYYGIDYAHPKYRRDHKLPHMRAEMSGRLTYGRRRMHGERERSTNRFAVRLRPLLIFTKNLSDRCLKVELT